MNITRIAWTKTKSNIQTLRYFLKTNIQQTKIIPHPPLDFVSIHHYYASVPLQPKRLVER